MCTCGSFSSLHVDFSAYVCSEKSFKTRDLACCFRDPPRVKSFELIEQVTFKSVSVDRDYSLAVSRERTYSSMKNIHTVTDNQDAYNSMCKQSGIATVQV